MALQLLRTQLIMNKQQLCKEMKRIGDRNRRFDAMTPERKRVAIARDTLAALAAQKILAKRGIYLGDDAQENGDKLPNKYECHACALGSMFVGLTTRLKDLSVKGSPYRFDITSHLSRYFSNEQLDSIEDRFENGVEAAEDSLTSIMQNIIDNNGTFKL